MTAKYDDINPTTAGKTCKDSPTRMQLSLNVCVVNCAVSSQQGGDTYWFEVLNLKRRWFWQIGGSGLW